MHGYTSKRQAGHIGDNKHFDWCHIRKYEYPEDSKYLIDNNKRMWKTWEDIDPLDRAMKYEAKSGYLTGATRDGREHNKLTKSSAALLPSKYGDKDWNSFSKQRNKLLFPGTKGTKSFLVETSRW